MCKKLNSKQKINCPVCNQLYIKQYISSHIKKSHPSYNYSKVVKRGMRFSFNSYNSIFQTSKKYFCKICKKTIKNRCIYYHNKTQLHKLLEQKYEKTDINDNNPIVKNNITNVLQNIRYNIDDNTKIFKNNNEKNNPKEDALKFNITDIFNYTSNNNNKNHIIKEEESFSYSSISKSKFFESRNHSISMILYTEISNGLIPMNFIRNHDLDNSNENKNDNELIEEEIYKKNESSSESISENSSSINGYEPIPTKSEYFLEPNELMIKKEVDEIFKKLINKKRLLSKKK